MKFLFMKKNPNQHNNFSEINSNLLILLQSKLKKTIFLF